MGTPAKQDERRRTDAQKRQTKQRLLNEADRRRRHAEWLASEAAARAAGVPINAQLTVISKTEDIVAVTDRLWRRLRRLMARGALPFIAARAPEYAPGKHHIHILAHIPERLYGEVANIVSDVTETVMAPWFDTNGQRLKHGGKTYYGVVTIAANGDWMLQRHVDGIGGSPMRLVAYGAKGQGKQRSIGRHQRSQHLIEITRKAAA